MSKYIRDTLVPPGVQESSRAGGGVSGGGGGEGDADTECMKLVSKWERNSLEKEEPAVCQVGHSQTHSKDECHKVAPRQDRKQ